MRIRYFLLFGVVFLTTGLAGINVDPAVLKMDAANNSTKDLQVTNLGEKTEYVQVVPSLLVNAGNKTEKYQQIKDPQQLGLLVSPNKLAIPAGQSRIVRVGLTGACPREEKNYQLVVSPVAGDLVMANTGKKDLQVGLKVIVAYGVNVTVKPCQEDLNIVIKRNAKEITIKNVGNVSVILRQGKQCIDAKHCTSFPDKKMYPGNSWIFTAPAAAPVSFVQESNDKLEKTISN